MSTKYKYTYIINGSFFEYNGGLIELSSLIGVTPLNNVCGVDNREASFGLYFTEGIDKPIVVSMSFPTPEEVPKKIKVAHEDIKQWLLRNAGPKTLKIETKDGM